MALFVRRDAVSQPVGPVQPVCWSIDLCLPDHVVEADREGRASLYAGRSFTWNPEAKYCNRATWRITATRRRSKPRHYCGVCANGGGGWDGGPSTPRQCLIRLHKHPGRENGLLDLRSIARAVHGIEIDRWAAAGDGCAAVVVPLRQAGPHCYGVLPWAVGRGPSWAAGQGRPARLGGLGNPLSSA